MYISFIKDRHMYLTSHPAYSSVITQLTYSNMSEIKSIHT